MLATLLGLLCAMQSTVEQNDVVTTDAFAEHVVECAVASAIDPQHTAVYYPMVTSLRLWTADVWKMDAEVRSARERDNGVDILYVAYVWREPLPGECSGFANAHETWVASCRAGWLGLPTCHAVGLVRHECVGVCPDCG